MTASLNGYLLNGSRPYATWAWGLARAEATATGEGSFQIANVWLIPADAATEATSTGTGVRLKRPTAVVRGNAQAALNDSLTTVFREAVNRKVPSQARSWIAEKSLTKIQVRQVAVRSDAIARSRSRSLANTALGFSTINLGAELVASELGVNIWHAYRGVSEASATTQVDSSRVRIIEGGMPAEAEARAEPTITTTTGRYSYNSGASVASAGGIAINTVLRRPGVTSVKGIAECPTVAGYLQRGARSRVTALAEASGRLYSNQHQFARAKADGLASLQAAALSYRPTVIGAFFAEAYSMADGLNLRGMVPAAGGSEATSNAQNSRHTWAGDKPSGQAVVSITAYARRGRIMGGAIQASAASEATGLRAVWCAGQGDANGSILKFAYRLNVNELAPDSRAVYLGASPRIVALPESDREYRIA